VEFLGPSRFSHWSPSGEPVGVAHPQAWVQIAAVSREQTKTTMALLPSLMSPKLINDYGVKAGAELIRARQGRVRLEAVTSSFRSLEGARSTFVVINESHHWLAGNGGLDMYSTIDGNATKSNSRYVAITNAFMPGEDSVAERMRDAWEQIQAGRGADIGFLYDSIESDPRVPLTPEALRIVIPKIRGDAVWLDVEAIIQSVMDLTIAPARSRRMWLNQIVAETDAVYEAADLAAIVRDGVLMPGDAIVLGFDGGRTDDGTALVAIRIRDGLSFLLGYWQAPEGPAGEGWEVDRAAVDSEVHRAFRLFEVAGMYCDVALWESHIQSWAEEYGKRLLVAAPGKNPLAWDMRGSLKRNTQAHERLVSAILENRIFFDGDPTMRRHALNAKRRENKHGLSFGKASRESKYKVDAYAAWMLAHEALCDVRIREAAKARSAEAYFLK
jgi:phage terminase large subunit-like protein